MAKVCVSDACGLLIPQLFTRPQNFHGRKCMQPSSVVHASDSRLRVPKTRKNLSEETSLGFDWMATVGGNADYFAAVPTSVPLRVAHELLLAGHRFLDVRTPEEFSTGHAVGAINIPYMFKVGSGMTKNSKFLKQVLSHFGKDDEIIVGCQSGKRSQMAATELISAGFTGITDIAGGLAAWTHIGLPTSINLSE